MPWNRGARAVADFITLDRSCNHKLRSYLEEVGKLSQLEADVEADQTFKADVVAALVGTGKTIQVIAGEIDNHESTQTFIETNHPNV